MSNSNSSLIGLEQPGVGVAGRPRYVPETGIEQDFGIPRRTLQKMRLLGGGPEYRKFGKSVRYDVRAVEAWIESLPRGGAGIRSCEVRNGGGEAPVRIERGLEQSEAVAV